MFYKVIHKETHEVKRLSPAEINDMFYDDQGCVIVCGVDQELYFLLADQELLRD